MDALAAPTLASRTVATSASLTCLSEKLPRMLRRLWMRASVWFGWVFSATAANSPPVAAMPAPTIRLRELPFVDVLINQWMAISVPGVSD